MFLYIEVIFQQEKIPKNLSINTFAEIWRIENSCRKRGGECQSLFESFPEIHPCWLLPFAVFFRASDISGKSSVFHVSPSKLSEIIKQPLFRIGEIQEKLKRDPRKSKERPQRHETKDSFCCQLPVWPPHLWGWPYFLLHYVTNLIFWNRLSWFQTNILKI